MTPELRFRIRYARTLGYHIFQRDATDEFIVKRTWDSSGRYVIGSAALSEALPSRPQHRSPYTPEEFARRAALIRENEQVLV